MKPIHMMLALAASALTATPALAQDSSSTDNGPTYLGLRAEVFGGFDFQHFSLNPSLEGADTNHTGGTGGILGGYDASLHNLVVGVYGSYALSTGNGCTPGVLGCVRSGRQIEIGGRLGFKSSHFLGNHALIYLKGAYVNTAARVRSTYAFDDNPSLAGEYYNTHRLIGGWRAGAGVEYALNRHAYIKAEYDYTQTGKFDLTPYGIPDTTYQLSTNQILGGFGIRF